MRIQFQPFVVGSFVALCALCAVAHGSGYDAAISADGTSVAFSSDDSDLVANDTNSLTDVFVRNLQTGVIERVSINSSEVQANGASFARSISGDGRDVLFVSSAKNLAAGDTDTVPDAFLRDRLNGQTELISDHAFAIDAAALSSSGDYATFHYGSNGLRLRDRTTGQAFLLSTIARNLTDPVSDDGRYVLLNRKATSATDNDVVVFDRQQSTIDPISVDYVKGDPVDANGTGMSADARYVVFETAFAQVVPNDTNGVNDIFLRDRQAAQAVRANVGPGGVEANGFSGNSAISPNGRYVVFASDASNLVVSDNNGKRDIFVRDLQTSQTLRLALPQDGFAPAEVPEKLSISNDGVVALVTTAALVAGDTNGVKDVYVKDLAGSPIILASRPGASYKLNPKTVSFGNQTVGTQSSAQVITLTNTGTQVLQFNPPVLGGTNPGQFVLVNHCGSTVAVGGSCTMDVSFHPTSVGAKSAKLKVRGVGSTPSRTVPLSGTGVN